jgi:predicted ATPase
MPHLLEIGLKRAPTAEAASSFPFSVPAIGSLPTLDVNVPVTLFVGENGSGKSTLLEGIAAVAELSSLGAHEVGADDTLLQQRRLGAILRLAWRPRSRQGFFLRAEDFFGYLKAQARTDARIVREMSELRGRDHRESAQAAGAMHADETNAARFLGKYDSRSHGESFIELFSSRVRPGGLYLLDEPEAPLSPTRQLGLLQLIMRAADAGAQFIIATHSPILLAYPGARIFSFDDVPIRAVPYGDLEHVNVMRDFLNHPEMYLRRLRS